MLKVTNTLKTTIEKLEAAYGAPEAPRITEPFEMILYENVAYLVDDARRDRAFEELRRTVGTRPADILTAAPGRLNEISELGGINRQGQVEKLVKAAQIALHSFDGDLRAVIKRPPDQARAALKKFPGIGDPGAEKILLFNKKLPVLALESNGLRVLLRVGFGKEVANYAASYRSVQQAVAHELPKDCDWIVKASLLLRRHGKELCKRTRPQCGKCPLAELCRHRQPVRG
jgi:endonuclease III